MAIWPLHKEKVLPIAGLLLFYYIYYPSYFFKQLSE